MIDALILLNAPPLPVYGQGALPGAALAHSLARWAVDRPPSTPADPLPTNGYLLPPAWQALVATAPRIQTRGWQSHFHTPTPLSAWCPSALLLLTHEGARLGVDLDPTPTGEWLVWWEDRTHVARLASSWQDLAHLVEKGPESLVDACHRSWEKPMPLEAHPLGDEPQFQTWASQQALPGQGWYLSEAGQAIEKDCLITRHPRHPVFWVHP